MAGEPGWLTRRDSERRWQRATGRAHTFQLRRLIAHVLEVEDLHFNYDSAVLIADHRNTAATDDDASPDSQANHAEPHLTALSILAAAYRHIEASPSHKLLVLGHTDRSGPDDYNLALSRKRAANVLHLLLGEREKWTASAQAQSQVEDSQQILKWLFEEHAWPTDPGAIDNQLGPNTKDAVERFQRKYNDEFGAKIAADGKVGEQTWGAFFDVYLRELRALLAVDEAGLASLQGAIVVLDAANPFAGCGENWPTTAELRSRIDRRVELVFFDPDELPAAVPLACHPSATQCIKAKCEIRNALLYDLRPLSPTPALPAKFRLPVHLNLVWADPDGTDHAFPIGTKVVVEIGGGQEKRTLELVEPGAVDLEMDRRKASLTLRLEIPVDTWLASPPGDAADPVGDRLVPKGEVPKLLSDGWRVFRLPERIDLDNADWSVDKSRAALFEKPGFDGLADPAVADLGAPAARLRVALDPHWQYLKFSYYDRKKKARLGVPALVVEGFRDAKAAQTPNTQSNWTTQDGVQALPWLLRKDAEGKDTADPGANSLLQFRTKAGTWIDSSADDRRLVTANGGPRGDDPGCNQGEDSSFAFAKPSAERLAYYDLPPVWKSRKYWGSLPAASDAEIEQVGTYDTLATVASRPDRPCTFSLDDIVLAQADLKPLSDFAVDDKPEHRYALFRNDFSAGDGLSPLGLFHPDHSTNASNYLPWFSELQLMGEAVNYIHEYPDWTRLVVHGGNLFDCFDQRVADDPEGVVGARAAVRWVDATTHGVGVPVGERFEVEEDDEPEPPAGDDEVEWEYEESDEDEEEVVPEPKIIAISAGAAHPFFSLQPYHVRDLFGGNNRKRDGRHDEWKEPARAANSQLGRYDLCHLRCCDVDEDGRERATLLRYHRYVHRFDESPNALDATSIPDPAKREEERKKWLAEMLKAVAERWSCADDQSKDRPVIEVVRGDGAPRSQIVTFVQELPKDRAHQQITVTNAGTRAHVSWSGSGAIDVASGRPPALATGKYQRFTPAHETGHVAGLPDEYHEIVLTGSFYGLPSFDFNEVPGAAFSMDSLAMMVGNSRVRARHFWANAEWLRQLPGLADAEFEIRHGKVRYALPHYPHAQQFPRRDFTYWPVRASIRHDFGLGTFDSFLMLLGADEYASEELPGELRLGSEPIDGLVVVALRVKLRCKDWMSKAGRDDRLAQRIRDRVNAGLNYRAVASFQPLAAKPPPRLKRCLVHVQLGFAQTGSKKSRDLALEVGPFDRDEWRAASNPSRARFRVAKVLPTQFEDVDAELDSAADRCFQRICQTLGMAREPGMPRHYTQAAAFAPLIQSVAGFDVKPEIQVRPLAGAGKG